MRIAIAAVGISAVLGLGGLAAGGAYAAGSSNVGSMHTQMTATSMRMHDPASGMSSMMGSISASSMRAMHEQMRSAMPADVRSACDEAHAAMTSTSSAAGTAITDHAAHHAAS